jgi:hypothetical protein
LLRHFFSIMSLAFYTSVENQYMCTYESYNVFVQKEVWCSRATGLV